MALSLLEFAVMFNFTKQTVTTVVVIKEMIVVVDCCQHLRSQLDDVRDSVSFGASKLTAAKHVIELYETLRSPVL